MRKKNKECSKQVTYAYAELACGIPNADHTGITTNQQRAPSLLPIRDSTSALATWKHVCQHAPRGHNVRLVLFVVFAVQPHHTLAYIVITDMKVSLERPLHRITKYQKRGRHIPEATRSMATSSSLMNLTLVIDVPLGFEFENRFSNWPSFQFQTLLIK